MNGTLGDYCHFNQREQEEGEVAKGRNETGPAPGLIIQEDTAHCSKVERRREDCSQLKLHW